MNPKINSDIGLRKRKKKKRRRYQTNNNNRINDVVIRKPHYLRRRVTIGVASGWLLHNVNRFLQPKAKQSIIKQNTKWVEMFQKKKTVFLKKTIGKSRRALVCSTCEFGIGVATGTVKQQFKNRPIIYSESFESEDSVIRGASQLSTKRSILKYFGSRFLST